jgi:hypothetical protein
MKAMCKRGRSSEVLLDFLVKFHRKTASCCQCCGCALAALLKECESFKEKLLFCFRFSAAPKKIIPESTRGVFHLRVSRVLQRATAGLGDVRAFTHLQYWSLTRRGAGSMLKRSRSIHSVGSQ